VAKTCSHHSFWPATVLGGFSWAAQAGFLFVVDVAQGHDDAHACRVQRGQHRPRVALPQVGVTGPPVVGAGLRRRDRVVPPGPVDDGRVCLDLGDRGRPEDPVVVLCLPALHAAIDPVRVDPEVREVVDVEVDVAFGGADVAAADAPLCSRDRDRGCRRVGARDEHGKRQNEAGGERRQDLPSHQCPFSPVVVTGHCDWSHLDGLQPRGQAENGFTRASHRLHSLLGREGKTTFQSLKRRTACHARTISWRSSPQVW
jgi:hypothetical protein